MDDLELSVPVGASGRFIELHHSGALQKAQSLWSQYCRVRTNLEAVQKKLCMCNEPAWLFHFAKRCHREHSDFEEALCREVERLETARTVLDDQVAALYAKLQEIEPSIFESAHTLSGAPLLRDCDTFVLPGRRSRDDVLMRDGVIAKNLGLGSCELCKRFDLDGIPIPERWERDLRELLWVAAYEDKRLRRLIHKMISDSKHRLRSP